MLVIKIYLLNGIARVRMRSTAFSTQFVSSSKEMPADFVLIILTDTHVHDFFSNYFIFFKKI